MALFESIASTTDVAVSVEQDTFNILDTDGTTVLVLTLKDTMTFTDSAGNTYLCTIEAVRDDDRVVLSLTGVV